MSASGQTVWPIADAGVLVQLRRGTNEVLLES